jgi:dTDP-4-amino-4,6-dideoxygalactose transaminase
MATSIAAPGLRAPLGGEPVFRDPIYRLPALLGGEPAFKDPIYFTRSLTPDSETFAERLSSIFASHRFTNQGTHVQELEARLASRLGTGFCLSFCNGTAALMAALRALDLAGEVITTPFTFPATVHAIEWIGLTPVFCDIDPRSYNLDVRLAAELVSSRTSALLPVHVFGNPCDVLGMENLARRRGLRLLYDAAHAFGVACQGRPIGCWGDLSVLSFHATKLFHTAEGGAVVGSTPSQAERLAQLRNFGIVDEEEVKGVGFNGKLSELHGALGLGNLERIDGEMEARARLSRHYAQRLRGLEGVQFQDFDKSTVRNHAYFTLEIDPEGFGLTRDQVHSALRADNIVTRKYFFPLCSENERYRTLPSAQPHRLPNAHRLASRILCLPLYGGLHLDDVDRIVDTLTAIRTRAARIRNALSFRVGVVA